MKHLITENLPIWTSAPNGIKKLRELILELAVRGLLVSQDPNDEPASELVKRIAEEKARLISEGKIKGKIPPNPPFSKGVVNRTPLGNDQEQTIPPFGKGGVGGIFQTEKPFALPMGWVWLKLEDIGHDWGQTTPKSKFTYVDVGAINKELGLIENAQIIEPENAPSRARKIIKKGTVIYSTVRPYLLNIAVVDNDFFPEPIASTAFAIIHPYSGVLASFVYRYLRSPSFIRYVESCQTGIAYPAINDKQFFSGFIPLPPEAEQQRIVAKVDELMQLCDQLEHKQNDNQQTHRQLVSTLLSTLTEATDTQAFQASWSQIAVNFDCLFTTESSIEQLKQTILQLAVMGKLVPQNPNDEPASELLQKIATEKARLIAEGKIKKQNPLPIISEQEKPFVLPNGWEWARLQQIIQISSGDGLTSENMNKNGSIPVYGGNGITGYHDKTNTHKPTLVIGRVGYYCGSIHITSNVAWVTDNAFKTTFSEENISIFYLFWLLKVTNLKENEAATAQPVISGRKVYPIVVGFPPLAEQYRIVAKVDELMSLCDQLKTKLANEQSLQQQLAETLVQQAVA